ncbi:MAG: TetR/AcrR family transcriptional regulator [Leucobacter sp.]|nr:TetR/AcrR family transcriptional regulator [Leucobacter sp.]
MPRITASTVAEHRANQERLLLDVAHAILEETGEIASMRDVAVRAGLARSSVYNYFESKEALLQAMVQDVFPKWTERITGAMAAEAEPSGRLVAYAFENLKLVHEGAHAVGSALAALTPGEALDEQATRMHRAIQEPLMRALDELGVADSEGISELINAVIHASTQRLESGQPFDQVEANLVAVIEPMAVGLQRQSAPTHRAADAAGT